MELMTTTRGSVDGVMQGYISRGPVDRVAERRTT
jgi:hypothetical protein